LGGAVHGVAPLLLTELEEVAGLEAAIVRGVEAAELVVGDLAGAHPEGALDPHGGGRPHPKETKAILSVYPQVAVDLAMIDWIIPREDFHGYLRELIRPGFGKRLLFGSDQMVWPEAIGMAVEGIESAAFLTEDQKRDIFYNNAVRFLKLDRK
jgi:predicted TIM-barrel fold metal-dependent hydrolase